jgi:DUF4097 and DUF4098 domain-containing protein YvlB
MAFLLVLLLFQHCTHISAQDILAEASFSIKNVKYLEIKGGFCNVELNGYSGDALKFDGSIKGSGNPDKYEIIYREENNRIKVWVEYPTNFWGNIRGLLHFDIPKDVVIIADNSSGNIDAYNLSSDQIQLEASSGNITAGKISGELNMKCSSGNITLDEQQGVTLARASSGNLKLENIQGDLTAHASSGNIQIYDVNGDVMADCSSGNIRLGDLKGILDIESSSGNIRGEDIMLTGDSKFKATSGNVTIGLLNDPSDLSFDLDAGSGSIYAAGSRADDQLMLKKGPIMIHGITSSGNQRYTTD